MTQVSHQDPVAVIKDEASDAAAIFAARVDACSNGGSRKRLQSFVAGLPSRAAAAAGDPELARTKGLALWVAGRDRDALDWLPYAEGELCSLVHARAQLAAGHPARALELLESAGDGTHASVCRAEALCALGDADGAETAVEAVSDPDHEADLAYLRGRIADLRGERGEARKAYEHALEIDEEHALSLFRLAFLESSYGSDERALELYRRCVDTACPPTNAYLNLGNLYEDRGEYAKARDSYSAVLKADPRNARARLFHEDAAASLDMVYDEELERRSDRRSAVLRLPVTDFELSVRSRNCLAKMGVHALGDLIQRTEAELLSYKNFGETSLQEIKDILAQKGLRLGMAREEVAHDDRARSILEGMGAPSGTDAQVNRRRPLSELELSVRSRHCMNVLNLKTVGDLVERTEAELMTIKNFGQTSLNEVKQKLAEMGLTLNTGK